MSTVPTIEDRAEQPYVACRATVTMQTVSVALPPLVDEVAGWLGSQGIEPAGPPFFKYNVIDMDGDLVVEVGFPVAAAIPGDDRVRAGLLPAGRYAVMTHQGPYDRLADATDRLLKWGESQGVTWDVSDTDTGGRWGARIESYETDPSEQPDPEKWVTELAIRLA